MKEREIYTLPALLKRSVGSFPNNDSLSFVDEKPLTYSELNTKINSLSVFLRELGIEKGDKVAILSSNMPNWGISYFAVAMLGAVVVPVLPDFHQDEISNVLKHSGVKAIFVSKNLYPKIKSFKSNVLKYTIRIEDFSVIEEIEKTYTESSEHKLEIPVAEDDLLAIIYTSGTTGKSKGVMLSHKNIIYNVTQGFAVQPLSDKERMLSILPLSHTYENTLGFLLPLMSGSAVYYLRKPPTPSILLPALQKVKPTMMLSVPLILEKIYRNKILKTFRKNALIKALYAIPPIRKKLNLVAGKKLYATFGGELLFFGIGGAKLDRTVEKFLREAKFPYAIGYGLTETAPLIAGANPSGTVLQATGKAVKDVELKINAPNPRTGEGEVWAKGHNIMQGYYKEPELTKEVLTEDGWFKTGDLGVFDKNGILYIKGRLKNMIVGKSGENIYPEDIESVINNFRHVVESVVIQQKGKLVAMVHFNREELEERYKHLRNDVAYFIDEKLEELRRELHDYVNSRVNKFSQVQLIIVQPDPFVKTATMKIKRFLYT